MTRESQTKLVLHGHATHLYTHSDYMGALLDRVALKRGSM